MTDHSDIDVFETIWITMPDGAKLAARLWLPRDAKEKPVPAIFEYIPYRRRDRKRLRDESMHPYLAAAGYACLRVDMRGSGDSDGIMTDEYSDQEIQDGADVTGWIADQPWCDGKVAMFGKSWGAFSAFQVAAKKPPALKAIAPVMGTDDRFAEDIHFYGGVLGNDNFWWGTIMQLYNAQAPDPDIVGKDRWKEMWKERLDAMTFWPAQWLEHQTKDETWRRGSISENYEDVQIPVYYVGGWADLYRDTPFRVAENLKGPVKILMGPWSHLYPHEAKPGPKADFCYELIRFFDCHLKGKDNGTLAEKPLRFWIQDYVTPAGYYDERPGRWIEEPSWPSPNVHDTCWWLNEDELSPTQSKIEGERTICSPQNFGSAAGDMCSFGFYGDMPLDCRIDAAGALNFKSPPLTAPKDILGQPSLSLKVSADKAQAFVTALLVDEAPDGNQLLIARGYANLMHRHSNTEPVAVVPGELMEIALPFHGIGYRIERGHRLVVQIASTYWPNLWPAPEAVTLTIKTGQSSLHLPERHSDAPQDVARALPEPPMRPPPRVTALSPGKFERTLGTDLTSGISTSRMLIDGGLMGDAGTVRLDDIGTELSELSERVYSIHPGDPLSAKATMTQDCLFERADWKVRIKTDAKMTATKTDFLLNASVQCWDGEELFHEVFWEHKIARNGM